MQRYVPQLIIEKYDGSEDLIKDQVKVEKEIKIFYESLFSNKYSVNCESIESFLGHSANSLPKLSEAQKDTMEGMITLEEMTKYLKKCNNNVAPGSSGFTFDFYKFFWRDLKVFIIRAVDYSFEHNRLSVSQRLGIINIIPKGDKDKRFLSNWRPLCLLNSLYKLIFFYILNKTNIYITKMSKTIPSVLPSLDQRYPAHPPPPPTSNPLQPLS